MHHLVRSLAQGGPVTIGLAPQILDTPQNRAAMPDADRTWVMTVLLRVMRGSFVLSNQVV